ncbi:MAG: hypothetical protein FWD51_04730 [Betaproteobacteria bacterium]|nr:hypothetical protein [Betaproteobacteria bacterium]
MSKLNVGNGTSRVQHRQIIVAHRKLLQPEKGGNFSRSETTADYAHVLLPIQLPPVSIARCVVGVREVLEAFINLPVEQKKIVRSVILTFAQVHAEKTPRGT